MKKPPQKYKTIFISDIHLGTLNCKSREVLHFLKNTRCDRLVLNGDIIDGWQLGKGSKWTKRDTKFIRYVLKRVEKQQLEVIYLRGNHDDILGRFLPLEFATVKIVEDYIHEGPKGRYLVLHGDVFDTITKNFTFLAHLGDWGYKVLMSINRWYNKYRSWRGKEYYSLSKAIKAKVKKAVSFISDFEEKMTLFAEARECDGVICGHIHTPADKIIGKLHYLNSGDWVESLSAIVERHDGALELVHFDNFIKEYPMKAIEPSAEDAPDDLLEDDEELPAPFLLGQS